MAIRWGWRLLLLSIAGFFAAVGGLGGFDARHFSEYVAGISFLLLLFWGIPIVVVTAILLGLEWLLGKYGRLVVTLICATPSLFLYSLYLSYGGDRGYVYSAVASIFVWAALWFLTAPNPHPHAVRETRHDNSPI